MSFTCRPFVARALVLTASCAAVALAQPATASADEESSGMVVVALPGAEAVAWSAAKEVYAEDALRSPLLDEAKARALVGEPVAPDAPAALRDLAEERNALRGEDKGSRSILSAMGAQLNVRSILVIEPPSNAPRARLFFLDSGTFDAAIYEQDKPTSPATPVKAVHWRGMVMSLKRGSSGSQPAASLATHDVARSDEKPRSESQPFYASPWFWIAAVGAAACTGAFVYLDTKGSGSQSTGDIALKLAVTR